jgi:hypothetical protein
MGRKSRQKGSRPAKEPAPARSNAREWLVVVVLIVLTFAVFGQVSKHSFTNYDDGQFIYENEHVTRGLTGDSITWALTSAGIGYYPITWLSHELDVQLWGLDAGAHLLTNVLIHALTACLLFFAMLRLASCASRVDASPQTRDAQPATLFPAAFIAALFAIHPMHVESVAWASERKDTLSTLFAVIALLLYVRDPRKRLGVTIALALSLAAKQMYITLPFVFLLLDYWPLNRFELKPRVLEKLPLFALSAIGAVVAFVGQRNLRAMQSTIANPLGERFANAAVAYIRYLAKLFVPIDLATPYPLVPVSNLAVIASTLLLIFITIAAIALRKRAPQLIVGWLWFLGTLVPVIGIVALGAQSMADRYSYFSYIGLFIAIAMSIPQRFIAPAAAIIIPVLAVICFHQTGYWKNSETLFTHAIEVTPPNPVAEYSVGQALQLTKPDVAIPHLQRAIELTRNTQTKPEWYAQAHVGLGTAFLVRARGETNAALRTKLINDALENYEDALAADPNAPHAKNNIAVAHQMLDANYSN